MWASLILFLAMSNTDAAEDSAADSIQGVAQGEARTARTAGSPLSLPCMQSLPHVQAIPPLLRHSPSLNQPLLITSPSSVVHPRRMTSALWRVSTRLLWSGACQSV